MKKIIFGLMFVILLAGCGKNSKESILKEWSKKVDSYDNYLMQGTLEIYRNEDLYTYKLESAYMKEDNYRVSLTNKTNNHEQIIIRNKNGVYVVTPSLNKSFKFQSEWPYNNSQIYLLQPIISDLENDSKLSFEEKNKTYIFSSKVNYINDKNLIKQKVYLSKDLILKKVEVIDDNNNTIMLLKVNKFKTNNNFDNNYFKVVDNYSNNNKQIDNNTNKEEKSNIKKEDIENNKEENKTKKTSVNDEILYPMYVPVNTYLNTQDVMKLDNGSRTILTFSGNSPFTLMQSPISNDTINYLNADPVMVLDKVGAVGKNEVSWIDDNKEYYVTSEVLSSNELVKIAESMSVAQIEK